MFKDFFISTYGGNLVYQSGTILAILVEPPRQHSYEV